MILSNSKGVPLEASGVARYKEMNVKQLMAQLEKTNKDPSEGVRSMGSMMTEFSAFTR